MSKDDIILQKRNVPKNRFAPYLSDSNELLEAEPPDDYLDLLV
jgi:hypothetical protein